MRQRIQLTSTNLPCGLTIFLLTFGLVLSVIGGGSIAKPSPTLLSVGEEKRAERKKRSAAIPNLDNLPGDYGAGVPPVPIPNTEVKPCSADGTAA